MREALTIAAIDALPEDSFVECRCLASLADKGFQRMRYVGRFDRDRVSGAADEFYGFARRRVCCLLLHPSGGVLRDDEGRIVEVFAVELAARVS